MTTYRVGRHLGRTIYRDDQVIGMMDSIADARMIVDLLNAVYVTDNTTEVDRNARAYGWEIGRGQPIGWEIKTTPGNPFLDPDWRTAAQGTDERSPQERPSEALLFPLNPEVP